MTGLDRMLDGVAWESLPAPDDPDDGPYATHIGYLTVTI